MRLIDADEFKKQEVLEKLRTAEFDDEIEDVIKSIPTAYDVDKVVEQLKEKSFVPGDRIGASDVKIIMSEKAVEIVKSGGID